MTANPDSIQPEDLTMTEETFGNWLRRRREEKGLSKHELARRAGCTGAYLSQLELGKTTAKSGRILRPSIDLVDSLARSLGVPQGEARLAAGYASPSDAVKANNLTDQVAAMFGSLPINDQIVVFELVNTLWKKQQTQSAISAQDPHTPQLLPQLESAARVDTDKATHAILTED